MTTATDALAERLLAELRTAAAESGEVTLDRLRTGIAVEQAFALTLTDEQLALDLTDGSTLRAVVADAGVRG